MGMAHQPDAASRATRGMPLRFLAAVLLLWTGGRIAAASSLMSGWWGWGGSNIRLTGTPAYPPERSGEEADPAKRTEGPVWATRIDRAPVSRPRRLWASRIDRASVVHMAQNGASPTEYAVLESVAAPTINTPPTVGLSLQPQPQPAPLPRPTQEAQERGWSATAWIFWRDKGNGSALNSTGQLGAAQAGGRIERRIASVKLGARHMPVLPYGRISAALERPHQSEAALGLAIRPLYGRVPLMIGVERRIALESSARNAFALVAAGGLNPTVVVGPVVAEGYAQAGVVGLSRRDMFVDGRIVMTVPLDRAALMRTGLSLSGGAQPNVSRMDIGPTIEARLPLGGVNPRLIVEWRERVAGNARPDSGLSITLASDF